jgi:ADP-L-glycero-D-manno-heptose 6-epimerase
MIIVTGAAGFIGSCLVGKLNQLGFSEIILVDDFSKTLKSPNLAQKHYAEKVERSVLFNWLALYTKRIDFVFHIGARTDTTEFNMAVFDELNLNFSKKVWQFCCENSVPLVYASSAATYGDGSLGYDDRDRNLSFGLQPLNPYGVSKNDFDKWALQQDKTPPRWYGMKFFNVFGPNEYHKGRMASVVFHAFNQIRETGSMRLFRSHNPAYKDGGQLRDFIYVKDVIDVLTFLMENPANSGIYNLGTGKARTFLDLARGVFAALDLKPSIDFIDTPLDIRDKYQYFTEAKMDKLHKAGYGKPFYLLETAIKDYVGQYLTSRQCF